MEFFTFLYSFLNQDYFQSKKWQMNFLDPATPIAASMIEMHHHVFFFLTIVLIFVSWMLYSILYNFWFVIVENNKLTSKDLMVMNLLSKMQSLHNTKLEIMWTLMPSVMLMAIAIPSFGLLYAMDDVIDPDMTMKVIGHQWYWTYEYTEMKKSSLLFVHMNFDSYMVPESELVLGDSSLLEVDNALMLPMGGYIRVNVTSSDVLHSWAVPSLGMKMDAVPQRMNSGIIYLQSTGMFYGQCSEICGVNHGFMPIAIAVTEMDPHISFWWNTLTSPLPLYA